MRWPVLSCGQKSFWLSCLHFVVCKKQVSRQVPQTWKSQQRQTSWDQWLSSHVGDQKTCTWQVCSTLSIRWCEKTVFIWLFLHAWDFLPNFCWFFWCSSANVLIGWQRPRIPLLNLLDCSLWANKKPNFRRAFKWKLFCHFEPFSLKIPRSNPRFHTGRFHMLLTIK